jgi:hypothetical protein
VIPSTVSQDRKSTSRLVAKRGTCNFECFWVQNKKFVIDRRYKRHRSFVGAPSFHRVGIRQGTGASFLKSAQIASEVSTGVGLKDRSL